jgi:hypothetical protein
MLLVQCLINHYGVAYYKIRLTEMVYEQCKKEWPTGDLLQKAVQRQKKLSLLGGLLLLLWSALFYCFQR